MIELDSSLARFLSGPGTVMAGGTTPRNGFVAQIVVGGVLTAAGVALGTAGIVTHSAMGYGAIGPLMAGVINLGLGIYFYRRFHSATTASVHLTDQARELLFQLIQVVQSKQVNPWGWQQYSGPGYQVGWNSHGSWKAAARQNSGRMSNINLEAIQLLEETARNYNRLASLGEANRNLPTELAKLAPRLATAAEEGIAEAFHHAAMMFQFPEGGTVSRVRIEAINRALSETADRAEAMSIREPSITERLSYRSAVDDVLEELRLTQNAHDELARDSARSQEELQN